MSIKTIEDIVKLIIHQSIERILNPDQISQLIDEYGKARVGMMHEAYLIAIEQRDKALNELSVLKARLSENKT